MLIEKYNGFIFDLDGTLYRGNKVIENADKVINEIKKLGKKIVFVSNKTISSIDDYYQFLTENNFNISKNEFVTSTIVTKNSLKKNYSGKNFFAIGEDYFINEIKSVGLNFTKDHNNVDILLITLDRNLNQNKIEIAVNCLRKNAKFFASNIDNTCPIEGGEIWDAGLTISKLEKMTNKTLEINFGKPSELMMNEILNKLNLPKDQILLVGDRLETDILMGNNFNIDTVLVSTGVKNVEKKFLNIQPKYVLNSVYDLLNSIYTY